MFEKGFHHEDVAKMQRFDYDIFGPLRTSFIKTLVNTFYKNPILRINYQNQTLNRCKFRVKMKGIDLVNNLSLEFYMII